MTQQEKKSGGNDEEMDLNSEGHEGAYSMEDNGRDRHHESESRDDPVSWHGVVIKPKSNLGTEVCIASSH
jgi:hypothetical protein